MGEAYPNENPIKKIVRARRILSLFSYVLLIIANKFHFEFIFSPIKTKRKKKKTNSFLQALYNGADRF